MADLVIYELHVGTFSPAGTFDGVIERLPAIRDLGATALELMPVAEFPGGRNWGYDGVSLYAVQSTYGGPEGLRRLVDAAHGSGWPSCSTWCTTISAPRGTTWPSSAPTSPSGTTPSGGRASIWTARTAARSATTS